jgi:hypothetical protein
MRIYPWASVIVGSESLGLGHDGVEKSIIRILVPSYGFVSLFPWTRGNSIFLNFEVYCLQL